MTQQAIEQGYFFMRIYAQGGLIGRKRGNAANFFLLHFLFCFFVFLGLKGEDLGKLNKEKVKELGGEDSSWVNIQKKLAKIDIEWGVKEKEEE